MVKIATYIANQDICRRPNITGGERFRHFFPQLCAASRSKEARAGCKELGAAISPWSCTKIENLLFTRVTAQRKPVLKRKMIM